MSFPTILYRAPGPHRGPNASTYDYAGANDETERDVLRAEGWSDTIEEALAPKKRKAEK